MLNLKRIIILSSLLIASLGLGLSLFKKQTFEAPDVSFSKDITNSLLKNVGFKEAAIFLYTDEYKSRYLLTSNSTILNPISSVEEDTFYSRMLTYNKYNICTYILVDSIDKNSELLRVLNKKGYRGAGNFYLACPIFIKNKLVGYLSTVIYRPDSGHIENLQALKFYAKETSIKLTELIY